MPVLEELQQWLGTIIAQPLQPNHQLSSVSPSGQSLTLEAEKYIKSTESISSHIRLEIYHQQYWWRLLNCLQKNFPMVTALFGIDAFQQRLAIPYLSAYPPDDWALCRLGHHFSQWLQDFYRESDSLLVYLSSTIDWAANEAFWTANLPYPPLEELTASERCALVMRLQPHIHLFSLPADLFAFREKLLEHGPHFYCTEPFPQITYGQKYFTLYRTAENMVTWQELSHAAYRMLMLFYKQGNSIEQACQQIEAIGGKILQEALEEIPFWFKEWTVLQWFGLSSS